MMKNKERRVWWDRKLFRWTRTTRSKEEDKADIRKDKGRKNT